MRKITFEQCHQNKTVPTFRKIWAPVLKSKNCSVVKKNVSATESDTKMHIISFIYYILICLLTVNMYECIYIIWVPMHIHTFSFFSTSQLSHSLSYNCWTLTLIVAMLPVKKGKYLFKCMKMILNLTWMVQYWQQQQTSAYYSVSSEILFLLKGENNSLLNKRQKQMWEAVKVPLHLPKVLNQPLLLSVHLCFLMSI